MEGESRAVERAITLPVMWYLVRVSSARIVLLRRLVITVQTCIRVPYEATSISRTGVEGGSEVNESTQIDVQS